ncbi:YdhR family protein [Bacillus toyonensis]
MEEAFWDLANSINEEEGFHWKIWTENEETKRSWRHLCI